MGLKSPNNLPVASEAECAVRKKIGFFCVILRRFCEFFGILGNPLGDL
jgi:hypothetical protein